MDDLAALVIDSGSSVCKAGFAGHDRPRVCISSVVGRPTAHHQHQHQHHQSSTSIKSANKSLFIGGDAQRERASLHLHHPVKNGIVTNWEEMEQIWGHIFKNELNVSPENHPILLTEPSFNTRANREQAASVLFEKFAPPALYIANSSLLALYASGQLTGTVLEVGGGLTQVLPIHGDRILAYAAGRYHHLAGDQLTDYLARLVGQFHPTDYFNSVSKTSANRETVREMKEQLCFVASDYHQQRELFTGCTEEHLCSYNLPDGQTITLGIEPRIRCAEALFRPSLLGREFYDTFGLHQIVHRSVSQCEANLQADLLGNIILAGGSSLFPGLAPRLEKELSKMVSPEVKIRVIAPADRQNSVWLGGSILASCSPFQSQWINRGQYDEVGPSVVSRMCPPVTTETEFFTDSESADLVPDFATASPEPEECTITCSICTSDLKDNTTSTKTSFFGHLEHCDHVFCARCILLWNRSNRLVRNKSCPNCRLQSARVLVWTSPTLPVSSAAEKAKLFAAQYGASKLAAGKDFNVDKVFPPDEEEED